MPLILGHITYASNCALLCEGLYGVSEWRVQARLRLCALLLAMPLCAGRRPAVGHLVQQGIELSLAGVLGLVSLALACLLPAPRMLDLQCSGLMPVSVYVSSALSVICLWA
jgi:hypothetical protein